MTAREVASLVFAWSVLAVVLVLVSVLNVPEPSICRFTLHTEGAPDVSVTGAQIIGNSMLSGPIVDIDPLPEPRSVGPDWDTEPGDIFFGPTDPDQVQNLLFERARGS